MKLDLEMFFISENELLIKYTGKGETKSFRFDKKIGNKTYSLSSSSRRFIAYEADITLPGRTSIDQGRAVRYGIIKFNFSQRKRAFFDFIEQMRKQVEKL